MKHEAHVVELKEDLYSWISDAAKDATGTRSVARLDIHEHTVAELEELATYWSDRACEAIDEQRRMEDRFIAEWEEVLTDIMELTGVDRVSAIAIAAEPFVAEDEYILVMDGALNHALGIPYSYDWIRGERYGRRFYTREV